MTFTAPKLKTYRISHLLIKTTLKRTKMKRLYRIARITHKRTETNIKIAGFVFACIMILIGSVLYRLIDLGDMTKYYF